MNPSEIQTISTQKMRRRRLIEDSGDDHCDNYQNAKVKNLRVMLLHLQ